MKSASFTLWIKRTLGSICSLERGVFLRVLGVFFYAIMEKALVIKLFARRFACKSF